MDKEQRSFSLHWGWANQPSNAITCVSWCPPLGRSPFPHSHESSAEFWYSVDMGRFRHRRSRWLPRSWGCPGEWNNHVNDESSAKGGLLQPLSLHMVMWGTPGAGAAYWKAVIAASFAWGLSGSHFLLRTQPVPIPHCTGPCKTEFCCFAAEGLSQLWQWRFSGAIGAFGGQLGWEKLSSCTLRQMGCGLV